MKKRPNKLLILIMSIMALSFYSCSESSNPLENTGSASNSIGKNGYSTVTSTEIIYENSNAIHPGNSTGWVSYSRGSGDYTLKIKCMGDFIQTTPSTTTTTDEINVQIKNQHGVILNNSNHTITFDGEYTYINIPINEHSATHSCIIYVPNNFFWGNGSIVDTEISVYRYPHID